MSKIRHAAVALAAVATAATGSLVAAPQANAMTTSEAKYCSTGPNVYCSMYYARGTNYNAKYGTSNSAVRNLQKALIEVRLGPSAGATGYFGSQTKAALVRYQASRKLRQTGVLDYSTLYALRVGAGQKVAVATTPVSTSGTTVSGGYSGSCEASHYWQPQPTASGEWFDGTKLTTAHKTLPMGTRLKVTNKANGKSVIVRVNDRGPYIAGRCLDLSKAAFSQIAPTSRGVAQVSYVQVK